MKKSLPVWGGIECTINRIKDNYHDQLESAGHYLRTGDIKAIASLGITMFRYPVLWEKHQPTKNTVIDWSFAREGIGTLMQHGIEPIIGLVHHGSGPSFTSFFDGSFESGLAEYATLFALAFPDAVYYTPINEPLTTARFCGLYGHWYPHKADDYSFSKILLSECKATIMAMNAIRQINPLAKLVATDDLGKTYATYLLQYQADFENERRWLSFDLISGRVNERHSLWAYFLWAGISIDELNWFLLNSLKIDILGLNYYITSERYLDEQFDRYPPGSYGGNGRHEYADVEMVRVQSAEETGFTTLVKEAWLRFQLPMAITEVHIHCTREEQLRWFTHIYRSCEQLVTSGIPIKGVTCWAMLGAYGWDKLLKEPGGTYEPGAFRICAGRLLPTALSQLIRKLCTGLKIEHPILQSEGWWHSGRRYIYLLKDVESMAQNTDAVAPLLIIGANGTLGRTFVKICKARNIHFQPMTRAQLDITNPAQIQSALIRYKPWAVINASGYVRVDDAETNRGNCYAVNTQGIMNIAVLCAEAQIALVNFSSDLVFDGMKTARYNEFDPTRPQNVYGMSKALAEKALTLLYPESLIIRTSAFFGPEDQYNFAYAVIDTISRRCRFRAAKDIYVSPTYIPDLANYTLDMLIDGETGIRHVCNDDILTWYDFAVMIAEAAGLDIMLIDAVPGSKLGQVAQRPLNTAMTSKYGLGLPSLDDAIARFISSSTRLQTGKYLTDTK